MPISANGGPWTNSGTGTLTVAVVPVTAGDLLVLSFNGAGTALSTSVSGGGVTTWARAAGYLDTGFQQSSEIWWGVVTTTGSATITVTNSGATGFNRLQAREWTGSASWSVLAASPSPATSGSSPSGTGLTVNYPSLTGSGLYVGQAVSVFGNMTGGTTTGFTYDEPNAHQEVAWNTAVSGTTAPVSATDNSGGYETAAAIFGGTAAPPTTAPPAVLLSRLTDVVREQAWERADWQAQGVADLTVSFGSSSGGVDTWNVQSPYSGNSAQLHMRVLNPTTPNANYPHAFLLMLPVDVDQGTGYGDPIAIAQALGAHNTYNLTICQPGYAAVGGEGPWYADNPLDPTISEEKYTLLVTAWIKANLAITGTEKTYLIGFSRSGIGAQDLQFRHPYVYAATASWDSPFAMTDYNGTDPFQGGGVGGNPAGHYGTSSSFQTRYELTATALAGWQATGQYGVNRIWIGGGPGFGSSEIAAYDSSLTTAGIPHTYTFNNFGEAHQWQSDWVAAALAAIIPSNFAETPLLPQRIPHPLFTRLLEVAAYRGASGPLPVPPAGSVPVLMAGRTEVISRAAGRVIRR